MMKIFFLMRMMVLLLSGLYANILVAQNYHTHTVKKGETLQDISKLYGISEERILKLNPDINRDDKLRKNDVLVIPTEKTESVAVQDTNTFLHKVGFGEKLEDIAKRYDIDEKTLKKYNPKLEREIPKEGDILRLPLAHGDGQSQQKMVSMKDNIHLVEKGETAWSISRRYNLTVDELKILNPQIGQGIKLGEAIVVKKAIQEQGMEGGKNYISHLVKPKETLYAISKLYGVSIETLTDINSEISTKGLYAGMALKIPKDSPSEQTDTTLKKDTDVSKKTITTPFNFQKTTKLALVLPMQLSKINIDLPKEEVKKGISSNRLLNYSLDFYFGFISAIDSLKSRNLALDVRVVDSDASRMTIKQEISKGTFDDVDVVLGPFYPDPYNELSAFLENRNVPILAPVATKEIVQRTNTILTVPKDDVLRQRLLNYMEKNIDEQKILIIADKENEQTSTAIKAIFPNALSVDISDSEDSVDIESLRYLIDPLEQNIVFIETSKVALISNVTSVLNSLVSELCKIQMVTTYRSNNYDNNISNNYLSNLEFTYPVINRYSLDNKAFIEKFIKTYGTYPNKYAIRGFDVTYDLLKRIMADKKNWFRYLDREKTEYLESRFEYVSNLEESGYTNEGAYIVRYKNMDLEELE